MSTRAASRKRNAQAAGLDSSLSPAGSPSRPRRAAASKRYVVSSPKSDSIERLQKRKKSTALNDEFAAERIDNETDTQYHIVWAGINPETRKTWAPTWEPKDHANEALIKDWEVRQRQKKDRKRSAEPEAPTSGTPNVARSTRRRKIVESSPQPADPVSQASVEPAFSSPVETQGTDLSDVQEASNLPSQVPIVDVAKPEDFDRDLYEEFRLSQLPNTQTIANLLASAVEDQNDVDRSESSVRPAGFNHHFTSETASEGSQIIPDSQCTVDKPDSVKGESKTTQLQSGDADTGVAKDCPLDGIATAAGVEAYSASQTQERGANAAKERYAPALDASRSATASHSPRITSLEEPGLASLTVSPSNFHSSAPQSSVNPLPLPEPSEATIFDQSTSRKVPFPTSEKPEERQIETFESQIPFVSTQVEQQLQLISSSHDTTQDFGPAAQPRETFLDSQSHSELSQLSRARTPHLESYPNPAFEETKNSPVTADALQSSKNPKFVRQGTGRSQLPSSHSSTKLSRTILNSYKGDPRITAEQAKPGSISFVLNGSEAGAAPPSGQATADFSQQDCKNANLSAYQDSSGSLHSRPSQLPTPEPELRQLQATKMPFKATIWTPSGKSANEIWEETHRRSGNYVDQNIPVAQHVEKQTLAVQSTEPQWEHEAQGAGKVAVERPEIDSSAVQSSQDDFIYPVLLEVEPRIRKLYLDTFRKKQDFLQNFMSRRYLQGLSEKLEGIENFLNTLHDATSHSDLIHDETPSQRALTEPTKLAQWDVDTSSKFKFLHNLLQSARGLEKHIVLMVKSGPLSDIVQTFLQGTCITYSRPERHRNEKIPGSKVKVTLLPTCLHEDEYIVERADLVIGFDESFDVHESQVEQVRAHPSRDNHPCPVIILIVANSLQHVQRSVFSKSFTNEYERYKAILFHAFDSRDDLGKLSGMAKKSDELGRLVAVFLSSQPKGIWELDTASNMDLPALIESSTSPNDSSERMSQAGVAARKRPLSQSSKSDGRLEKYPRFSGIPSAEPPSTGSVSRVEDSTALQSKSSPESGAQQEQFLTALESSVGLEQLKVQLLQCRADMAALQTRFEDQSKKAFELGTQIRSLQTAKEALENRKAANEKTVVELKDEHKSLHEELRGVREHLANSSIPEQAEWENLRAKAAESEVLKKRLDWRQDELDHARKTYQEASAQASELAAESKALRAENGELKRQASGAARELRNTFTAKSAAAFRSALRKTQLERDDAERRATKLQELNASMKEQLERRAGMALSTRASSVPNTGVARHGMLGGGGSGLASRGPSSLARNAAAAAGDLRRDAAANTANRVTRGGLGSRAGSRQGSRQNSPLPR